MKNIVDGSYTALRQLKFTRIKVHFRVDAKWFQNLKVTRTVVEGILFFFFFLDRHRDIRAKNALGRYR